MAYPRVGLGYELEVRGRTREIEKRAFDNVLAQVELADRLGYDTAWFVEHHFTRGFSHSSAPDLTLAALSQRTGRGASPLEYQAFGRPFEQSRRIWEDTVDAVLKIWAADGEPVGADNPYFTIPDVAVYPRPQRRPHPPVWVASTSIDGYLAAARRGYHLMGMTMLKGLDDVAEDIAAYRRGPG